MDAPPAIIQMVTAECSKANLDPYVILGIMKVESGFNQYAMHYDEGFSNFSTPEKFANAETDLNTEKALQRISYGLLQIEGATLRWLGFTGRFITALDQAVNISYGIKFFKLLTARFIYLNDQISAYNMGTPKKNASGNYINQGYVDKVLEAIEDIRLTAEEGADLN